MSLWNPAIMPLEANVQWAHLRAMEWRNYPAFLSQGLAPLLLLADRWKVADGDLLGLAVRTAAWLGGTLALSALVYRTF